MKNLDDILANAAQERAGSAEHQAQTALDAIEVEGASPAAGW